MYILSVFHKQKFCYILSALCLFSKRIFSNLHILIYLSNTLFHVFSITYEAYWWTFSFFPTLGFTTYLGWTLLIIACALFVNKSKGWIPVHGIAGSKSYVHFEFCQLFLPNYPAEFRFPFPVTLGDNVHFPTISSTLDVTKLSIFANLISEMCPNFYLYFFIFLFVFLIYEWSQSLFLASLVTCNSFAWTGYSYPFLCFCWVIYLLLIWRVFGH